jgi:hypothetical protein
MLNGRPPIFKPIYTDYDNVKVRLTNKVQFQADPSEVQEGELPDLLLGQLICDAETAVEQDLRTRYMIPFQSKRTGKFRDLPDHSQRAIRRAVDYRCVMEILRTDFGRGTHVDGESYYKNAAAEYTAYMKRLMGQDEEGASELHHGRFRFSPPLEDVRLAVTNHADDGYRGMIINTDWSEQDAASYAGDQINNPAASYINRRLENPSGE